MARLSDEILMAYVDGQLTAAEKSEVEMVLRADPVARQRLHIFETTGTNLSGFYSQPINEPVPDSLMQVVESSVISNPGSGRSPTRHSASYSWNWQWNWQMASAACSLVLFGFGAGWWVSGLQPVQAPQPAQTALVSLQNGNLIARGTLEGVLEKGKMGQTYKLENESGNPKTANVDFSFTSQSKEFCRQYQIAVAQAEYHAGLACRTGAGEWQVRVHTPVNRTAGSDSKIIPSGKAGTQSLDAFVGKIIKGDVYSTEQETVLIEKNWTVSE